MKKMKLILSMLIVSVLAIPSFAGNGWIGNFTWNSLRSGNKLCDSNLLSVNSNGIMTATYSKWDRQRAIRTTVCFEVYVPGITDQKKIAPGRLAVATYAPYKYLASFVGKKGNNWVYLVNVKDFDPLYGVSASGNKNKELKLVFSVKRTLASYTPVRSSVLNLRFE